jgi:hypothetical protein
LKSRFIGNWLFPFGREGIFALRHGLARRKLQIVVVFQINTLGGEAAISLQHGVG